MRGLAFAAATVLALSVSAASAAWDVGDMNKHIDETNVLVDDDCSGTIVTRAQGLILTADHCTRSHYRTVEREVINDKGEVETKKYRIAVPGTVSQLVFANGDETQRATWGYTVKASDYRHDLALVQTKAKLPEGKIAETACADPARGDTVYAVGNPFAVLYGTVTKGTIASVNRTYRLLGLTEGNDSTTTGDERIVQHTAPIEGGNSGGALYNDEGELVGVNVRASRVNETLAFSVPLADIRAFLKDNGISRNCQ